MVTKSWNAQYNWIWVKVRNEILQFISVAQHGISHCFHPPTTLNNRQQHNALQDFISDSHSKPAVVSFPRFHDPHKMVSMERELNKLLNDTNYDKENMIINEMWSIKLEFPNFFWGVYKSPTFYDLQPHAWFIPQTSCPDFRDRQGYRQCTRSTPLTTVLNFRKALYAWLVSELLRRRREDIIHPNLIKTFVTRVYFMWFYPHASPIAWWLQVTFPQWQIKCIVNRKPKIGLGTKVPPCPPPFEFHLILTF